MRGRGRVRVKINIEINNKNRGKYKITPIFIINLSWNILYYNTIFLITKSSL